MYASRKKERQKAVAVNPFMAMMYKSMSFNVWSQVYGKVSLIDCLEMNLPKRTKYIMLGLEREISDEDQENKEESQSKEPEEVAYYETDEDEILDEEDLQELTAKGIPLQTKPYLLQDKISDLMKDLVSKKQKGFVPRDLP